MTIYKLSQYFPKPYNHFGGATGIDTSNLALK